MKVESKSRKWIDVGIERPSDSCDSMCVPSRNNPTSQKHQCVSGADHPHRSRLAPDTLAISRNGRQLLEKLGASGERNGEIAVSAQNSGAMIGKHIVGKPDVNNVISTSLFFARSLDGAVLQTIAECKLLRRSIRARWSTPEHVMRQNVRNLLLTTMCDAPKEAQQAFDALKLAVDYEAIPPIPSFLDDEGSDS